MPLSVATRIKAMLVNDNINVNKQGRKRKTKKKQIYKEEKNEKKEGYVCK